MKHIVWFLTLALLVIFTACKRTTTTVSPDETAHAHSYLLIGSYSDGTTPGISVYDFDTQTGAFECISEVDNMLNPLYLAVSSDKKYVYSANETEDGTVSAFAFDPETGTLQLINTQSIQAAGPCYIALNDDNTAVVTANYSGGNISVLPIRADRSVDTLVTVIPFAPQSHIHTVVFTPDGKYLLATNLGKDQIYSFALDAQNTSFTLSQTPKQVADLPAGSGPRHLAFHPTKNVVYCITELSGMVEVLACQDGVLQVIQEMASDTTPGTLGKGSADIHLTPDGKFLYTSNRLQADGLAIFSVDSETGKLTKAGYQPTGIHPRNFTITPNGKYLLCANRDSNNVQIFEINPSTGLLTDTQRTIPVNKPACLKWIT